MAAILTGWYCVTFSPFIAPVGNSETSENSRPEITPTRDEHPPGVLVAPRQQVVGADAGHHHRRRDHRPADRVGVLPERVGVGEKAPQAVQLRIAVHQRVGDGVLHPRVGGDDEEARDDGAERHHYRGEPVNDRRHALLAEEEQAEERRLGEEREDALHEERLPDHSACEVREARPVGAELELHRDAGDHPHAEGDREHPGPEAGDDAVAVVLLPELHRLQHRDQHPEPHREDGEQVVEHDREAEVPAVGGQCVGHGKTVGARCKGARVQRCKSAKVQRCTHP